MGTELVLSVFSVRIRGWVEIFDAPDILWILDRWVLTPKSFLQAVLHIGQGVKPNGWSWRAV